MELGHCGQAAAIIKPRGVAEMRRRDNVRPCQQPQRVAFKRPSECVWNTVTWQSASVRALHRLSLFITLNISHETNELDLPWSSLFWIWWITWNGPERRSVDEEREQGNTDNKPSVLQLQLDTPVPHQYYPPWKRLQLDPFLTHLSRINISRSSFWVAFNETGLCVIVNKAALLFINLLQASSFFWNCSWQKVLKTLNRNIDL